MGEATAILENLAQQRGFQFHPLAHDWRALTKPFFKRLHGHKQVTDACLLGHAVLDGLILATLTAASSIWRESTANTFTFWRRSEDRQNETLRKVPESVMAKRDWHFANSFCQAAKLQ
jgi:hypothetical protein